MSSTPDKAITYITSLVNQNFWGTLTLKFQRGEVVHITKEESIQPNQLIPEHRRNNSDSSTK